MNEILNNFTSIIEKNYLFAPFLALFAGVLASFSPCNLSSIPLILGYLQGTEADNYKKPLLLSITYAIGTAITFTILGIVATLFGNALRLTGDLWYLLFGIILVLMVLQLWDIINVIPSTNLVGKNKKRGYFGAFSIGLLAGLFSSPCSTPVLIIILTIIGINGNLLYGIMLLLLYSIGHSVFVIIAGTSYGVIKKIIASDKYDKYDYLIKTIFGLIILLVAYYMFYLGF
jgi:cytochrome c-type biogenesis protein